MLLCFVAIIPSIHAQQSAAGQDTLIAVVGPDYVMMGADSALSGGGGIALASSDVDKLVLIHDGGVCTDVRVKRTVETLDDLGCSVFDNCSSSSLEQQATLVGFAGDAADGESLFSPCCMLHYSFYLYPFITLSSNPYFSSFTADRLMGILKAHIQIREYEAGLGNDALCLFDGDQTRAKPKKNIYASQILGYSSAVGLDSEAVAHLARSEISARLRSSQSLQLCLLVGGMVRCTEFSNLRNSMSSPFSDRVQKQVLTGSAAYSLKQNGTRFRGDADNMDTLIGRSNSLRVDVESTPINSLLTPKLFWLDQYGSLQSLLYGAHGYGSNFALSVLDRRYRSSMTRQEAVELLRECFEQLRQRYIINSPNPPRIKCIDADGVRDILGQE